MARKATKSRSKGRKRADEEPVKKDGSSSAPPRAIWNGNVSFGLVNVPVTLHSFERKFDLSFKLLDSRNNATIRYERVNEVTGEEVPWDEIVKAYEYSKGNYVVLTEDEFKEAAGENEPVIEIRDFVKREQIADVFFEKPYIVAPAKRAEKGYVLLREVLKKKKVVGIARVPIRTREYLAAIMPLEEALVVMILRYGQELRSVSDFAIPEGGLEQFRVSPRERELAEQLVESMTVKWEPSHYADEYRERLMAWIEEKAETGSIKPAKGEEPDREEATNVIDLTELLRKSMGDGKAEKKRKRG
jgi:DNA end-binding protein Ku